MSPKMIERYSHVRNEAKWAAVSILQTQERLHNREGVQNEPLLADISLSY